MSKSIPVKLGDEIFTKKEEVEVRVQAMISSYNLMDYINKDDMSFCLHLFRFHPNYEEKVKTGIKAIQVRLDKYGKRYFHLFREDGSDDDISWTKCLRAAR
jgi:ASC-1-like (ASCH) protein